jgi:hypothetical protein
MSRGPGRWQRAILDELQRREVFYVREVLPATATRSDQLAVIRAAHRLGSRGLLVVDVERQHWTRAAWGAVDVARPGVVIDRLTLAACYRLRDNLSDSIGDSDPLSLSRSEPELLAVYRQSEAAERALKAAQHESKAARQAAARARFELTLQERVNEVLRAHAERQLQEKRQREQEDVLKALKALRPEPAPLSRSQLGAAVAVLRHLAREGPPTDVQVQALMVQEGWDAEAVQAALDQLRASGDYQRIIAEARP